MNKLLSFLLMLSCVFSIFKSTVAQVPSAIPYQGVARNSSGEILSTQSITLRISLHDYTANGQIIYLETHNVTTTALGLFSLNIGTGTPIFGNLAFVNWSNAAKFLQVEMIPAGGTFYIDMGTTQLMSVPYALHAKTADVPGLPGPTGPQGPQGPQGPTGSQGPQGPAGLLSNGAAAGNTTYWNGTSWVTNSSNIYNNGGNVGIGTITPASSAILELNSTAKGFLMPRMTFAQRNLITPTNGLMIYNLDSRKPNYFNGLEWYNFDGSKASASDTLYIGKPYLGGLIAYMLQPWEAGYQSGVPHGIIVASTDQIAGISWFDIVNIGVSTSTNYGTGQSNTTNIVTTLGAGNYAAKLCDDLILNGYSDWYLPSRDELNIIYSNKNSIGGFANDIYWSSSQFSGSGAWGVRFTDGANLNTNKGNIRPLRAVRTF